MRIHNELELACSVTHQSNAMRERNEIDKDISEIIGRPAERGHIGEFDSRCDLRYRELHESAALIKVSDGVFLSGRLAGRTVNIKSYGKREGILDMKREDPPDFYLVLTGPTTVAQSSHALIQLDHATDLSSVRGHLVKPSCILMTSV